MNAERQKSKGRRRLRSVLRVTLLLAAANGIIVVCLMFLEDAMIYFPSRYPEGDWNPPDLTVEDVWLSGADGVKLHGWYVPCAHPKAYGLFFHGNAGNVTHRAEILRHLVHEVGMSVLIVDYRGYGRSEGKPGQRPILADARQAQKWLIEREKISAKDIVLMGESLGGAVAVDLAAETGARALVLICTFSSLPDVAAHHYPLFPVRLLMRSRYDSESKIKNYHGPLFQYHGTPDSIVPIESGKRLFNAANEPKRFTEDPQHDHNDPLPEKFYAELRRFLEDS
ncbi:MAG: alpha/beta hydrolase [Pirellulales bacterium]|nr:alpha/beta hydrolase [Pirellulales bacterium]